MNATINQHQALIVIAIGIFISLIALVVANSSMVTIETGHLAASLFSVLAGSFGIASYLELRRHTIALTERS